MKKIMPVILIGASLITNINIAHAAKKTDSASNVWEDSQSKEWGNTPESVKYVLSNVQISRSQGNNGGKQTDLFSTKWLKEMQRSPSTYRLTDADKKWVDNVLANAESKNSNTWKPGTKTPTVSKEKEVKQQQPAETVSKQEKQEPVASAPQQNKSSSFLNPPKVEKSTKAVKESRNKAESRPLPQPKIEAKNVESKSVETKKTQPVEDKKSVSVNNEKKSKPESVIAKENIEPAIKPAEVTKLVEKTDDEKFIESLPVLNNSDNDSLDNLHEEMMMNREYSLEKNIQQTLEKEDKNDEDSTAVPEVKLFETPASPKKEESPVVSMKENNEDKKEEKLIQSINEKQDSDVKVNTLNDDKQSEIKMPVVNNNWISSALFSLGSIAFIMLFIFLGWTINLKKTGKINKYL